MDKSTITNSPQLHCHSEHSINDSTLTPTKLVEVAIEKNVPAIALTDHGTLTGIFEFIKAANANGIKAIPGVEAYVQEDGDLTNRRKHLVLLAKDYKGYQAISRAVTKSHTRQKGGYPLFNKAILREFFGKGSIGEGKVVATSACVGGVLAGVLLENDAIRSNIEKLEKKASKYASPNDKSFKENVKLLNSCSEEIKRMMAERDALKKIADRKFAMREKALAKFSGDVYDEMKAKLDADKEESKNAAIKLSEIKSEITKKKKREVAIRRAVNEAKKEHEKREKYDSEIRALETTLQAEEALLAKVEKEAKEYKSIFGEDFYVELQYHGIPEEAKTMPILLDIAKKLDIKITTANDVHFAYNTEECVRARKIVSALRFTKVSWPKEREDDGEYYLKTDKELKASLSRIFSEEIIDEALNTTREIADKCNVIFPKEMHFPKYSSESSDGETSLARLRRLTEEGILKRYPNEGWKYGDKNFKYRDRVEYELKIIEQMGYTDYLCIVQDYISFARKRCLENPEKVGYKVGPGRGSAAGSLVCYLIGITSVDPIPLGLIFERFLNPDRVSSPDIDVDFAPSIRDEVIEYVKEKYGEAAICCITTKGTYAAKKAIRDSARVRGSEVLDDDKGFSDLGDAIARCIPDTPGIKLKEVENSLFDTFKGNKDALGIISDAKLIEGTISNYGMHAAGVIIADNGDVGEYVPLLWNSAKNQWCTQCDKEEAEAQAGLLKFDFLGLINLDIINDTIRKIKKNYNKTIVVENIPQDPKIYSEIYQKGKTNFVFQFESSGMKSLLKKFKPQCLEDLILLNAVYRPGPMQFIDGICEVKSGRKQPEYICETAKDALEGTYGFPVFQEQIMALCNKVAGFSLGEADIIRRYMSKKKADKMAYYKPKFVGGLINSGAEPQKAEEFWEQLMNFAMYAFNKSHAAVYSVVSYYTAYLKYYYPAEYMSSVMNYTSIDKLPAMVQECNELGVKVLPPNVNESQIDFVERGKSIIFGLKYIKSVGAGANAIIQERQKNGPFRSFKEFLTRVNPPKNVCFPLIDAGALDLWCKNRAAMKFIFPSLQDDLKKIEEKTRKAATETDENKINNALNKANDYRTRFQQTVIPISMPECNRDKLNKEYELLGMYASGHPLDEYPEIKNERLVCINDIENSGVYYTIYGVVNNLKIRNRKKDNAPMAFFSIEDRTGKIDVCCFAETYKNFGDLIQDNNALIIEGKSSFETDNNNEVEKKIVASDIRLIKPKVRKIIVSVAGMHEWVESLRDFMLSFVDNENGMPLILYDKGLGEFRQTKLSISSEFLSVDSNLEFKVSDI